MIAAGFLVWRDERSLPVDGPHQERLRAIAKNLKTRVEGDAVIVFADGTSAASILKTMFKAHFPRAVAMVEDSDRARRQLREGGGALKQAITRGARAAFLPDDGRWITEALIDRAVPERIVVPRRRVYIPGIPGIVVRSGG